MGGNVSYRPPVVESLIAPSRGSLSFAGAIPSISFGGGGGGGFTPAANIGVTGDFADGGTLDIVDVLSRFGTKRNGAKPLMVFTHQSNRNPVAAWSRNTGSIAQQDGVWTASPSGVVLPANQNGCIRTDMTNHAAVSGTAFEFTGDKCIDIRKEYINWNWTSLPPADTNWKHQRYRSANDGDHTILIGFGFDGDAAAIINENTGGLAGYLNFIAPIGSWYTCEHFYQGNSAADSFDARVDSFINARCLRPFGAGAYNSKSPGLNTALTGAYGNQISNNTEPANSAIFTCFEYKDDDWCSVFWSSETSYQQISNGSGTQYTREYCIPTAWGAGGVSIINRFGEFSTLVGKRLYLRTSDGTVILLGVKT